MASLTKITGFLTLTTLCASQALAWSLWPQKPTPAECQLDPQNPFSITANMVGGPHKGDCINTHKYRSAHRLTQAERASFFTTDERALLRNEGIDLEDDSIEVVANFEDAHQVWVAVIPVERVQNAIFQLTNISGIKFDEIVHTIDPLHLTKPILHGQLRFQLTETGRPIELFRQTTVLPREHVTLHDDLVFSLSGVRPAAHEEPYDPIKGLLPGYYGEEFSLGSHQEETLNWIIPLGYHTMQYRLDFAADQSPAVAQEINTRKAQTILHVSINVATENGLALPYNTLTASCLNTSFSILNTVQGLPQENAVSEARDSFDPVHKLADDLGLIVRGTRAGEGTRIEDLPQAGQSAQP